ncbi:hypothetical protein CHLRE_11g476550v5 [Chlamydomonas reinhardtii]|uniref:Enoyl reductase (ER) domain-containing protein n=1 Tax=Chlamydomonas reinhardtii TaxID=3055 RepID=A8J6Y3_CHLRE|nr:uncharacterized protein CHLRE_11g476550v5 [Chlamydomonas reinhardtii]PNW76797.1 hypothetical protein CHLRE_11g476550v5 [Chlamydomonas reinhardtii]|eukprot:XP_001697293.1 predicted protein [Chlamydomonas reinhardtii]
MAAIPETQTAVVVNAFGPDYAKNISIGTVPVPKPGQGEVLVRITCRPLNPADVFSALGVYPGFTPKELPAVLGLEGVGSVAALGPGCSGRLAVGQRVVATRWLCVKEGNGTWRQYAAVPEEDLIAIPDELADEAACQALINPIPVVGMFQEVGAAKGDYVIVTAAGSALGRMAISYGKNEAGVKVIGTVRRPEQVEELKAAGADEVIVVRGLEDAAAFKEKVLELTGGKGAAGVLECVAGDMPAIVSPAVRDNGVIIMYGAMNGIDLKWNVLEPLFRGVSMKGFWVWPWMNARTAEERRAVMERVVRLMVSGVLPPHKVDARPLEGAVEALQYQATVGRDAKLVLRG